MRLLPAKKGNGGVFLRASRESFCWFFFFGYVSGSGYSMRDDRLGIHRECRRLFFFDCLRTGVADWALVRPMEGRSVGRAGLVGAGF